MIKIATFKSGGAFGKNDFELCTDIVGQCWERAIVEMTSDEWRDEYVWYWIRHAVLPRTMSGTITFAPRRD